MKKPEALLDLLDELEPDKESVKAGENPRMMIHTTQGTIELNLKECQALLQSEETADQLFSSIGKPTDAYVDLVDLTIDGSVFEYLEQLFESVDVL